MWKWLIFFWFWNISPCARKSHVKSCHRYHLRNILDGKTFWNGGRRCTNVRSESFESWIESKCSKKQFEQVQRDRKAKKDVLNISLTNESPAIHACLQTLKPSQSCVSQKSETFSWTVFSPSEKGSFENMKPCTLQITEDWKSHQWVARRGHTQIILLGASPTQNAGKTLTKSSGFETRSADPNLPFLG